MSNKNHIQMIPFCHLIHINLIKLESRSEMLHLKIVFHHANPLYFIFDCQLRRKVIVHDGYFIPILSKCCCYN